MVSLSKTTLISVHNSSNNNLDRKAPMSEAPKGSGQSACKVMSYKACAALPCWQNTSFFLSLPGTPRATARLSTGLSSLLASSDTHSAHNMS